jgi:hypothetical protein
MTNNFLLKKGKEREKERKGKKRREGRKRGRAGQTDKPRRHY